MATPNASSSTIKGADGRGPHNAATPQSQNLQPTFSSPAPRSVPSPAAQRQAGKSPFTASTQAQSNPSTTAQNHPTVGSSGSASKGLLGSSPAAAMLNFESPMGMGMSFSLSQMGGVGGGVPMAAGMSGLSALGLTSMAGTSDEEKWRRLNEVMEKLKSRPGRVSLENVRALGKRLGFEEMLEQPRTGNSILTFAGRTVMVEMAFSPQNEVTKVDVQFPEPTTALQETAASASQVFYNCLTVPVGKSSITNMLDRFATNLEKLAKIDKPHGAGGDGFNGFEAISGIYSSLRKLYSHERELAQRLYESSDDAAEKANIEVTCKKSGRPRMNEDGKIGLYLDYWITRRYVRPFSAEESGSNHQARTIPNPEPPSNDVFTLSVQCEAIQPGHMTQPARISDAWISDTIENTSNDIQGERQHNLDWLEPSPTFISPAAPGEPAESTAIDQATGKLPTVRFVAKLSPPLMIPLDIAEHSGITEDFSYHTLPTHMTPLLVHKNPLDVLVSAVDFMSREIHAERVIAASNIPGSTRVRHANTLRTQGYDPSILLYDIPFDHPKQLIQLLPMLRQFAFLNTILQQSFPAASTANHTKPHPPPKMQNDLSNIDMTVSTSPIPKLTMTFSRQGIPKADKNTPPDNAEISLNDLLSSETTNKALPPVSVQVSILPNAEIQIGPNNVWTAEKATGGQGEKSVKLGRALDVAADLDIWIEFVKEQASKTKV